MCGRAPRRVDGLHGGVVSVVGVVVVVDVGRVLVETVEAVEAIGTFVVGASVVVDGTTACTTC